MSALVNKTQFARIYGCSKAYVSQLVAAKRLALVDQAGTMLVDVAASLELLGGTSDPSKAGVRERWAEFRAAQAADAAAPAAPASVPAARQAAAPEQPSLIADAAPAADKPAADAPGPSTAAHARSDYQYARTRREQAEAEMAQIELLKVRGRVLEAEVTLRAVTDAHIAARTELMSLADRVTPLVAAETQPRKVWELINAECERLAERMQSNALRMASAHTQVPA